MQTWLGWPAVPWFRMWNMKNADKDDDQCWRSDHYYVTNFGNNASKCGHNCLFSWELCYLSGWWWCDVSDSYERSCFRYLGIITRCFCCDLFKHMIHDWQYIFLYQVTSYKDNVMYCCILSGLFPLRYGTNYTLAHW